MSSGLSDSVRTIVGIALSAPSFFIFGQNFSPVHFWEIQIQQNEVGPWGVPIRTFLPKKGHRFDAIIYDVQRERVCWRTKRLLRQSDIAGVVFDQKNVHWLRVVVLVTFVCTQNRVGDGLWFTACNGRSEAGLSTGYASG